MVNLLQGVWVFITFVLKRNVLKVVTRRTDHLYSEYFRSKSSKPSQANMFTLLLYCQA